jgi:hypothetical protein
MGSSRTEKLVAKNIVSSQYLYDVNEVCRVQTVFDSKNNHKKRTPTSIIIIDETSST